MQLSSGNPTPQLPQEPDQSNDVTPILFSDKAYLPLGITVKERDVFGKILTIVLFVIIACSALTIMAFLFIAFACSGKEVGCGDGILLVFPLLSLVWVLSGIYGIASVIYILKRKRAQRPYQKRHLLGVASGVFGVLTLIPFAFNYIVMHVANNVVDQKALTSLDSLVSVKEVAAKCMINRINYFKYNPDGSRNSDNLYAQISTVSHGVKPAPPRFMRLSFEDAKSLEAEIIKNGTRLAKRADNNSKGVEYVYSGCPTDESMYIFPESTAT